MIGFDAAKQYLIEALLKNKHAAEQEKNHRSK
jgi:hypothetical protein